MVTIRDERMLAHALSTLNSRVADLLRTRWDQVTEGLSAEDIADIVKFVVAEPGDTAADLERAVGFPVFRPDFSPEWAEYHEDVGAEIGWVWGDDGAGAIAIVPCGAGMDSRLLKQCRALVLARA